MMAGEQQNESSVEAGAAAGVGIDCPDQQSPKSPPKSKNENSAMAAAGLSHQIPYNALAVSAPHYFPYPGPLPPATAQIPYYHLTHPNHLHLPTSPELYGQAVVNGGTGASPWFGCSPLPMYPLPSGLISPAIGPHSGMVYLHPAYAEQLMNGQLILQQPSATMLPSNSADNENSFVDNCGNEADDEADEVNNNTLTEPVKTPVIAAVPVIVSSPPLKPVVQELSGHSSDNAVVKDNFPKSLISNATGSHRNLYIRGLKEHFTDDQLFELSSRFGRVISAKVMMDSRKGICRGYGFALFYSETEAMNALVGLNSMGYQVSFAKESLTTQLKRLQDQRTTNIYLSNLPRSMDELELTRMCENACGTAGGKVMSARILRNEGGESRGVGFARMDRRNNALLVIDSLNGFIPDGAELPLQLRFADNDSQKRLKVVSIGRRRSASENNHTSGKNEMPLHIAAAAAANSSNSAAPSFSTSRADYSSSPASLELSVEIVDKMTVELEGVQL